MVDAQPTYGFWAWVALIGGISGTPKRITWRCRRCGEIVRETRSYKERQAFRQGDS